MEDFANLLQRDYGFKPQGKMAPMSAAKSSSGDATGSTGQVGAMGKGKSSSRSARTSSSFSADDDLFFGSKSSGRPAYGASSEPSGGTYDDVFGGPPKFAPPKPSSSIPVYDDIFRTQPMPTAPPSSKDHSFPVFDSPYDDDIFLGVRGTRTAGVPYDNVFSGGAGASSSASPSEDLLGGYRSDQKLKSPSESHSFEASPAYDDELLPGLGSGYPKAFQQNERASFISVDGSSQNPAEVDPFGGIQPDPFSNISAMPSVPDPLDPFTGYPETKSANGVGDGIDGFDIFSQPIAKTSSNKKSSRSSKDRISDTGIRETPETKPLRQNFAAAAKQPEAGIGREPGSNDSSPKKKEQVPVEDFVPAGDLNSEEFTEPPVHDMKESWITIDDVRLITAPTAALPPSRPAPGFTPDSETLKKEPDHDKASNMLDEMEEFATAGEFAPQEEEAHTFSSGAAAMNEAIERTEAKLKRTREKEKELKARNEDNEEQEQREEKEREEREKERHRRERDRERERDRAAVERATQEARDRAAIEARERAERAAVERATAEARERAAAEAKQRAAEKTAVERAAKEARHRAERAAVERANAEARERAERAAAERAATGRVTAEARERAAERAAVGRVSAEARERAAAAAAAAAREQQRRSDDLDDLFGARANSAPKQRPATSDFMTDTRPPKGFTGDRRSSTGAPFKKVSSVSGIDELTGLFGNPSSSEFQEVEGETPDRRKARLERDRRTLERAQKALADKHQRDLNAQREQAEKHRVGEALDAEIKRWAAGKEGNIRALLSTLQYVLWPECGWQPVSLTDLITGASVKKVYRRATLCVHPDKVQQKGATVQQKYIAEKVFDMLKEAWNKLNAEELF